MWSLLAERMLLLFIVLSLLVMDDWQNAVGLLNLLELPRKLGLLLPYQLEHIPDALRLLAYTGKIVFSQLESCLHRYDYI